MVMPIPFQSFCHLRFLTLLGHLNVMVAPLVLGFLILVSKIHIIFLPAVRMLAVRTGIVNPRTDIVRTNDESVGYD